MQGQRKTIRNNRGSTALTEGSVAIMLINGAAILIVMLLLGSIVAIFYKMKLTFVATSAANVAANGRYWLGSPTPAYNQATASQKVSAMVTGWSSGLGLGTLSGSNVDLSDPDYCAVTVQALNLPMLNGPLIPSAISLQERAFAPYIKHSAIGVYGLSMNYPGRPAMGMYMPSYGCPQLPPSVTPVGAASTLSQVSWGDAAGAHIGGSALAGCYQNNDGNPGFSEYYDADYNIDAN